MFRFELRHQDGEPFDPPSFQSSIPSWSVGEVVLLNPRTRLRVVDVLAGGGQSHAVLVVEEAVTRGA